jgi:ATP-dependent DNA helicase RecG
VAFGPREKQKSGRGISFSSRRFRVELFRVNPITDQANQATNQANQDLERLDQVEDENVLSEKEIEILNLVRMQPSITQKEMANALDWNLASVKYYITKLKEKNYLKRQGSSQKGKGWVILAKRD